MRLKKRDFFPKPWRDWNTKPKRLFVSQGETFFTTQGFNLEVMLIEQVVVVNKAVNEFAGSDQKMEYTFQ